MPFNTIEEWMQKLDSLVSENYMVSIYDLPDFSYYDYFDCGNSPEDFFNEFLYDLEALKEFAF